MPRTERVHREKVSEEQERPDAEAALRKNAQSLAEIIRQYPDFKLTIEGHCDERGSEEYNLALGDARAKQAQEYLAELGLPSNQLRIVSYGKDRPVCTERTSEVRDNLARYRTFWDNKDSRWAFPYVYA